MKVIGQKGKRIHLSYLAFFYILDDSAKFIRLLQICIVIPKIFSFIFSGLLFQIIGGSFRIGIRILREIAWKSWRYTVKDIFRNMKIVKVENSAIGWESLRNKIMDWSASQNLIWVG